MQNTGKYNSEELCLRLYIPKDVLELEKQMLVNQELKIGKSTVLENLNRQIFAIQLRTAHLA